MGAATLTVHIGACVEETEITTCNEAAVTSPSSRPDLPIVRYSEHLDIHASPDVAVCAGTALEYEHHVVFIAGQLGIDDLRSHIPIYLYADSPGACEGGSQGCTKLDGVAHARVDAAHHELAHAVACELKVYATPALAEGLAVMFEPKPVRPFAPPEPPVKIVDWIAQPYPFREYYDEAGHFSRWWLEQRGSGALAELYSSAWNDLDNLDIGVLIAELAKAYGTSTDELELAYSQTAPHMWIPLRQCDALEHVEPQSDGSWIWSGVMDCDADDTFGPYPRRDVFVTTGFNIAKVMYHSFTFEVPMETMYEIEMKNVRAAKLERCAERHPQDAEDADLLLAESGAVGENLIHTVTLSRGIWRANLINEYASPTTVEVTIRTAE